MRNAHFSRQYPIRFSHCDPAGIVYFPQYLVLTNWLVEDWFTSALGIDFADLIGKRRRGLPLVKLDCEFVRPSRQGDLLTLQLRVAAIGASSLTVDIEALAGGETRMRSRQVMVHTCMERGTSAALPDDIRAALEALLCAEEACS